MKKLVISLIALSFFFLLPLLLSDITQTAKREEAPGAVKKEDFFFKDFNRDAAITGNWIDKNYVINMQIKSIKLDLKLAFIYNKASPDVNNTPNDNSTPKQEKINKFRTEYPEYPQEHITLYPRNATCPAYELNPRHPGLMSRAWDHIVRMTTRAWEKCCDITVTMAGRVCNGVTWFAEWTWVRLTCVADWISDGVTGLAGWTWEGMTWLAERTWSTATWLAENGVKWTGKLITPTFNYVTDVVSKFYAGYLDRHVKYIQASTWLNVFTGHVKYIQARIVASTWQDVFNTMSAVFAVNFILLAVYLFVSCTVKFIRRKWQAYKDRKAAASLPTPAPKKPRSWRPKPKPKQKKRNYKFLNGFT